MSPQKPMPQAGIPSLQGREDVNCDDWLEQLDPWLDGQLPELRRSAFEAHRSSCADCRRVADDARRVQRWARELPAELPPPVDRWPEIHRRIERPAARGFRAVPWPWALCAAALLALVSSAVTARWTRPGEPAPTVAALPADGWEGQIRAATADLTAAVEARRHELDPEALRIVDQNLAIIDRAIAEIREAMARSPGDPRVEDALVAAYNRKIRLLQQTLRVPVDQG